MEQNRKYLIKAFASLLLIAPSAAFLNSVSRRQSSYTNTKTSTVISWSRLSNSKGFEFDSLLGEGLYFNQQQILSHQSKRGRRNVNVITLPNNSVAAQVLVTSSVADTPVAPNSELAELEEDLLSEENALLKYEEERMDEMMEDDIEIHKYTNWKERKIGKHYPSVNELWDKQDYLGIMWKWGFPIAAGVVGVAGLGRVATVTFNAKTDEMLQTYANEMVYHDGDFEEMKMCHRDWSVKLNALKFTGQKKKRMISQYLETYAKKKPVSPQAVSSLSYVFSLYKLTEQKAAQILYEVAKKLENKPASAGKLLFFGTHILKSPEGKAALQPIQKMLASTYKVGGDMFVANSQKSMAESAYKSAVAASGGGQTTLTPGWDILGLNQETAQRIFNEVAKDGFLTGAQKLYGGINESKFDSKGRKIDDKGKVLNPVEDGGDDGDDESAAGTVFECSECGYTMFPAKGREFKFIPEGFTCPECGAAKDKFVDRSKEK